MQIVLSGAKGWIGQTVSNVCQNLGFPVLALSRDFSNINKLNKLSPFFFVHAAFPSRERLHNPTAYLKECGELRGQTLRVLQSPLCQGMIYTSSGAVHISPPDMYGAMKRCDEIIFMEAGKPLIVPRIFNLSGPWMTHRSSYLLGSLIDLALRRKPLIIESDTPVYRSFLAASDLVRLLLCLFQNHSTSSPLFFDACGTQKIEAYALALKIKKTLKCEDLPIQRTMKTKGSKNQYLGDPTLINQYFKSYGLSPQNLSRQILSMMPM